MANSVMPSLGMAMVPRWDLNADAEGYQRYKDAVAAAEDSDPLARRLAAVRANLSAGPPKGDLWEGLARAEAQSFLEEAILFDLLDADLEQIFLAQRDQRMPHMIAYIKAFHTRPQ